VDWVTDVVQNLSAYWSNMGREGTSILFYMRAHIPLCVLVATTVFGLLSEPCALLLHSIRIQAQGMLNGNIYDYDALNRFKLSITHGGYESFPQLVLQACTYLSVASLAGSVSTITENSKFSCIDETEVDDLDEAYTFGPFLAISVCASLISISVSQWLMVTCRYLPGTFTNFVQLMTIAACVLNTMSLSFVVVDMVTVFLDIMMVMTCRLREESSFNTVKFAAIALFLLTPSVICLLYDKFFKRKVDIVEDDFKQESCFWNTVNTIKALGKMLLDALISKLRLPAAQLHTFYEEGYKYSLSPKSDIFLDRLYDHCVFWIGTLMCNIILKSLCVWYFLYIPSEFSTARSRFQLSCYFVVPLCWLLSHACFIPMYLTLCLMYPADMSFELDNDINSQNESDSEAESTCCPPTLSCPTLSCHCDYANYWREQFNVEEFSLKGKWKNVAINNSIDLSVRNQIDIIEDNL